MGMVGGVGVAIGKLGLAIQRFYVAMAEDERISISSIRFGNSRVRLFRSLSYHSVLR
jgi:hypothetical protein